MTVFLAGISKYGRGSPFFSWRYGVPAAVVILWSCAALLGPWLSLSPNDLNLDRVLSPPDLRSWTGYDELGRSLTDRLIVGARVSFIVAVTVVLVSLTLGIGIGLLSAWFGGWLDHVLLRLMDMLLAFPGLLLAIALAGVLGPGIENVIIALCATGWVGFARLARGQALSVKRREHVLAAVALGCHPLRVLVRHVLPALVAPLTVEATFAVAGVVIAEAGLSFLGLGVQPPDPSWGTIIKEGTRYMLVAPHLVIGPAIVIMLVVFAVNQLGDALRDSLDVRSRRTR